MAGELTVELHKFTSNKDTALVGRKNGENFLKTLEEGIGTLAENEGKFDKINIFVPKRIVVINKSFFLGLFETRVISLGKEGFLNKYNFDASDYILKKIPKYVDTALLEASMEDILNVRHS
jgi:hypothetical protein